MNELSLERWQQIDTLFAEALERPPDERTAFLRHACGDDPTLYYEVVALLESDAEAERVLGESATRYAAPLLPHLEARLAPDTPAHIGPYRVLRELGHGGMGTVYLAERADGTFEKEVALKLVRRGLDTDEILRRFRHERQILAALQHPHIAHLYDGGRTDDGRPFLVLEYVDGVPIDRYCDANTLTVTERLHLFRAVCEAVQYAHQNLVVHRDLKPSNMLVTETGRVKLLDFGIAKLLAEEADPSMPMTRTGMRVMTPEYAAPEQIRGEPVTTATDVYALGVVLYELLTGRRPYAGTSRDPLATEHAALDAEPTRPSIMVTPETKHRRRDETTETLTPEQVSRSRGTTPERLQRRLRGDLDVILLKALRKEPERRYASAKAFLDDVKRHLAGLPVQARPDTVGYRLRKFVDRHRFGVMAAVAFVLLLAGFITVYTARVTQERNVARQERDKAEEVAAFLEGLFDASDPFAQERLDTMQVRTFLTHRMAQVQEGLADQPLVRAQMLNVMGNVYKKLGLFDQAQASLEQALQTRVAHLGPQHVDVAETQADLAAVYEKQERYDDADSLSRLALATRRALLGNGHPTVAASLHQRAALLRDHGAFDEAEPLFKQALTIYRAAYGDEDSHVLSILNDRAVLANDRGHYAEAERRFRELIVKRRELLGDEHPLVAVSLNNLATVLRAQGYYGAAEAPIREALAINRKVFGDVHPHVADNMNTLAALYRRKGDYDEAERLLYEAMDVYRQLYGPTHSILAYSLTNLGEVRRDKGDYAGAEQAHREARALVRENVGAENVGVGIITGFVARVLYEKGDYRAAEPVYREALAHLRRSLPEGHERTCGLAAGLGASLTQLGRYEEAEPLLLEGYQGLQRALGAEDERTRRALAALTTLYDAWGKPQAAARYRTLLESAGS